MPMGANILLVALILIVKGEWLVEMENAGKYFLIRHPYRRPDLGQ